MIPRVAPAQLDLIQQRMWVPDDVRDLDGWLIRRSRGVTKRANSVLPHGTPPQLEVAVRLVEQLYRQQRIEPCFQITASTLPVELDDVLAGRGYTRVGETLVLVAHVEGVLERAGERSRPVHAAGAPDGGYARLAYPDLERGLVMAEIGRRTPSVYASMRRDGRVFSAGRGSLAEGWLGLSELVTAPDARRQGLATDIIAELARRARDAGIRHAVLQVEAGNPAESLYRGLGFTDAGRYHYRVAPQP